MTSRLFFPGLAFPVLGVTMLCSAAAWAGPDRVPPVRDELTRKECGECHMVFQPAFLPAAVWNRMMDRLDDHFGEDASLSADKAEAIRRYLTENAGFARRGRHDEHVRGNNWAMPWASSSQDQPELRITTTRWFLHEHRLPPHVWQRPEVKSPANCPACHHRAEEGIYDEDR